MHMSNTEGQAVQEQLPGWHKYVLVEVFACEKSMICTNDLGKQSINHLFKQLNPSAD